MPQLTWSEMRDRAIRFSRSSSSGSNISQPQQNIASSDRLIHLDMARGLAALAVLAGHLRNFQFVIFPYLNRPASFQSKVFYCLTSFGHEAVMVFFVLSGYFVGGSVLKDVLKERWSWLDFARKRLTRLYVVLIPALVLTLFWDQLGRHLSNGQGYAGSFDHHYHTLPYLVGPAHDDATTFLGNVGFLQTISVSVYGTNAPLWSLAYEFWYYLMFPALLTLFSPRKNWLYRVAIVVLLAGCWRLLPAELWEGSVIWLLGCGVRLAVKSPTLNARLNKLWVVLLASGVFVLALTIFKVEFSWIHDCVLGLSFAFMLPYLIGRNSSPPLYRLAAIGLSNISYTLYTVHFPLIAFFFFCFRPGMQVQPSALAYLEYFGGLVLIMAYASGVWWLFESRTDRIRKILEGRPPARATV